MTKPRNPVLLSLAAGTLIALTGCGDANPYSAENLARSEDPVALVLTGVQSVYGRPDVDQAVRAIDDLTPQQKLEFVQRGGLVALLARTRAADRSSDALRAATSLLASVPPDESDPRLCLEDAQALRNFAYVSHDSPLFEGGDWAGFVGVLPPRAAAHYMLAVVDTASTGYRSSDAAQTRVALTAVPNADPDLLVPGLISRLSPQDGAGTTSPSSRGRVVALNAIAAMGERGTPATEAVLGACLDGPAGPGAGLTYRSGAEDVADAAWAALAAITGDHIDQVVLDAVDADPSLLARERVVRTLYEAGRIDELRSVASRSIELIAPDAYALALAQGYRDSLPRSSTNINVGAYARPLDSGPYVPMELTDNQADLAAELCYELAALDHTAWVRDVVGTGAFRTAGAGSGSTAVALYLRQSADATERASQILPGLRRREPSLQPLTDRELGGLAFVASTHVLNRTAEPRAVLEGLLGHLKQHDDPALADLYIASLEVPFDNIQALALNWMRDTLGPERATAAFFENFRNRDSYSRRQIDLYVGVLASLNEAEHARFAAASLQQAADRAGSPEATPWATKYIALRVLQEVGDAAVLPTLRPFLGDRNEFSERIGDRETVIGFAELAADAIEAIEERSESIQAAAKLR